MNRHQNREWLLSLVLVCLLPACAHHQSTREPNYIPALRSATSYFNPTIVDSVYFVAEAVSNAQVDRIFGIPIYEKYRVALFAIENESSTEVRISSNDIIGYHSPTVVAQAFRINSWDTLFWTSIYSNQRMGDLIAYAADLQNDISEQSLHSRRTLNEELILPPGAFYTGYIFANLGATRVALRFRHGAEVKSAEVDYR